MAALKKSTTTVNEFFTWYSGKPQWKKDWQITNSMIVGNLHAQDESNDGKEAIKRLVKYREEKIKVKGEINNFDGTWDLKFTLKGKKYEIGATAFFGEEGY